MLAKFEVFEGANGTYQFRFRADTGEIALTSESHSTFDSARIAVASSKINAMLDTRYERQNTEAGFSFALRSGSGDVLGRSETFPSAAARENVVARMKLYAPDADVVDLRKS